MLFIGKPSISMGHLYHGYVSHNQRVGKYSSTMEHLGMEISRNKKIFAFSRPSSHDVRRRLFRDGEVCVLSG